MAKLNTGRSEKQHNVDFAKGGKTPMFGKGDRTVTASTEQAGEQKPGVTEHDTSTGGGDKFASGGSTKMFGFSPSTPAQAGITSPR